MQEADVSESENDDTSSDDEDADRSNAVKRRRIAQSMGERLGLSERSIMDAKQFANVSYFRFTLSSDVLSSDFN